MSLWLPYILLAGLAGTGLPAESDGNAPGDVRPIHRTGDQITLKSGKVLHGIKIIRKTPFALTLKVIPGVDPLIIPAKQVASIQYGALDPRFDPPPPLDTADDELRVDVLPATKTSSELIEKMGTPFTEERLLYESQDIVSILYIVAIRSGVPVSIGESVEQRPLEDRKVSLVLDPGATMDIFIDEVLAEHAPWLKVRFGIDELHFEVRDTWRAGETGQTAPGKEKRPGVEATGP